MTQIVKTLQVMEFDDGSVRVVSSDKRQMARWYGLDYLKDKAQVSAKGSFYSEVASNFYFAPTFRKKNK